MLIDILKYLSAVNRGRISFSATARICQVIGSMRPEDSANGMKFIGGVIEPS